MPELYIHRGPVVVKRVVLGPRRRRTVDEEPERDDERFTERDQVHSEEL